MNFTDLPVSITHAHTHTHTDRPQNFYGLLWQHQCSLTWHLVVQPLGGTGVCLDVSAVHRPVQVGDEAGATRAATQVFVALGNRVDVNEIVVGSHCEVVPIRGVLHLMEDLLAVLDMGNLRQISAHGYKVTRCPQEEAGNHMGPPATTHVQACMHIYTHKNVRDKRIYSDSSYH